MKKVFISKGEVVHHDYLYADKLIVKGVLLVDGKITAKEIIGGGVIEAREIVCDNIRADIVKANEIYCRKIAADKLFVQHECYATDCMAVSDFIGAGFVSTGILSMSASDIRAVDAVEIITLPQKRRSLLGLLWASWWKSLFMSLLYGGAEEQTCEEETENAQVSPAPDSISTDTSKQSQSNDAEPHYNDDMADMLGSILIGLRQHGYRVSKVEPPIEISKNEAA